ncbi:hypothetical protein QJS83_09070 [Bdellovibrio sp. 22V]|uniref:hypothetical protein n=1 Tax=Bdellovibrio sp. 22V TaxID=3044166 RepID=UPI0025428759|nr:hypothetical protein [Bdellovibrio sp. 22V]WII70607.1 hypothetical protein QJS83_09070 [Bdellovibrio sp. 22V]
MKHLILVAALILGASSFATAGELDNESSVTNQAMNGTVVIRVDTRTNKASVLTTEQALSSDVEAQALAQSGSFQDLSAAHVGNELDRDGGASSWYFYNNYNSYYYASMYWYGSWYNPCYSYAYSYYRYYYYSYYGW